MPPKRRLSSLTGGEEDLEDPLATEGVEEIIMEEEESVLGVEGEVIQQAATIPPHAMPQLEQERQRSITPEPGKKRKKIDPVRSRKVKYPQRTSSP